MGNVLNRFGTSFQPTIKSKVAKKRKVDTITCNEGTEGEQWYSSTLSVTWVIDGQRYSPAASRLGWVSARCLAGWLRPRAVLEGCGKLPSRGDSIPWPKCLKMFKQNILERGTDTLFRNIGNMPPFDSAQHCLVKVPFSVTLFISSTSIPNFRDGDYFWNNWRCNTVWDVLCYCVVYWICTSSHDGRSELLGFYIVGGRRVEYGLGALVGWCTRIREILEGNPHPASLYPPRISSELSWYRIQVSAIKFQRLFLCIVVKLHTKCRVASCIYVV